MADILANPQTAGDGWWLPASARGRRGGGDSPVDLAQQRCRQFVEKTRRQAVARLSVQQAGLRVAQVETVTGAGNGHVHQPPLLLQPVALLCCVLVREKTLFETCDEDDVELQPLGSMDGHQLHCFRSLASLVLASLQRGMRQKGSERPAIQRGLGIVDWIAFFVQESGCRVDQFVKVLKSVLALPVGQIVLAQAACLDHVIDHFRQEKGLRVGTQGFDQAGEPGD